MGYTLFIVASNLIIPIIMLFFGMKFRNHGPEKINSFYGYRTTMSKKNKDTWEFAHLYFGKLWRKIGGVLLIFSLIISVIAFLFNQEIESMICLLLLTVQMVVLIASIFPVEKALKKNFDQNGNRVKGL
ncbi:SdpI family protein [Acetobacterium tundrae]|uniref:SdpI family protein n=1 Tax=Acetobacterium tundrae TaxID=132932 RepID=A0ABR6WM72_9FIRM|nr:SdpI family protein [Acetobacterium tundrae]MBC3797368.1 hypothetical protein [Acetobacterium tundrae]